MSRLFNVPAPAWVALITFVSGWVNQYFSSWELTAGVTVIFAMLLKGLEMLTKPTITTSPPPGVQSAPGDTKTVIEVPSNGFVRFFFGP